MKLFEIEEFEVNIESKPEDRINYDNFPPGEKEFYEYLDREWRKGRKQTNEEYRDY